MKADTRIEARSAVEEADAYIVVSAQEINPKQCEISVYKGGKQELTSTLVREMLNLVQRMLFGEEDGGSGKLEEYRQ